MNKATAMSLQRVPFKDLIQISPDGEFVRLSSRMIRLQEGRFGKLWDFAFYALNHYAELYHDYPITDDPTFRLELRSNGDIAIYPPPVDEKGQPIYAWR